VPLAAGGSLDGGLLEAEEFSSSRRFTSATSALAVTAGPRSSVEVTHLLEHRAAPSRTRHLTPTPNPRGKFP